MSNLANRESSTNDGNGLGLHKTHGPSPKGTPRSSDWQELAPQQKFERRLYHQQQPGIPQQQYQLPPRSQAFSHSFQCGMTDDVSNCSMNDARNMLVPTPQAGTPWMQSISQHDLGRNKAQASYHIPDAAFPGGDGQDNTGLAHPHYSTLSEPQSSPGERSRDGVVMRTTPSLDYSSNASHSRRQSVSGEGRTRHLWQEYATPRRVDSGSLAFLAGGIPSIEDEKLLYQAVMHMDDLTRYNRAAYVMESYGHPRRSPDEYESRCRGSIDPYFDRSDPQGLSESRLRHDD